MGKTPDGIETIPVKHADVVSLLNSNSSRAIEDEIAHRCGATVLRDESPELQNLTKAEISVCGMTVQRLEQYLVKHRAAIVEFATELLCEMEDEDEEEFPEGEQQDPDGESEELGYASGFGVTHAIYHYFLAQGTAKELRAFLKNRRIPRHTKFAKELESVFAGMRGE